MTLICDLDVRGWGGGYYYATRLLVGIQMCVKFHEIILSCGLNKQRPSFSVEFIALGLHDVSELVVALTP